MVTDLAVCVQRVKLAAIFAISARANELLAAGKDIINLSMGEPDFDTPVHIKEAAIKAIQEGFTKYTAVDGIPSLKKAIIQKFATENRLNYEPSQIIVSAGAKQSLYNLFTALLNPDDEIIIPSPYWIAYADIAQLIGAKPICVQTQAFKLKPEQLQSAISIKTRLVILNSPSNPTGAAYSAQELSALAEVLLKHPGIVVASDDIYEHTLWNPASFTNILMACPDLYEQCVIINGVSKAYAMTGWRIGYAAGPSKIIRAMKVIQSQCTSNPNSIAQAAAQVALTGDQSCIATMTKAYKERHDWVVNALQTMPGVKCHPSDGTFYSFPHIQGIIDRATNINNDIDFTNYLLNQTGIALVPGSIFGAPEHVRISYAIGLERIKEAMKRMQKAIEELLNY